MELEVKDLTAGYGNQPVLFEVSASFRAESITALIGPNGAGKSTLINAIFGVARIFGGTISIDGKPVPKIAPEELVKRGVAYVPQLNNVFPSLSVRENLEIGTYIRGGGSTARVLATFPELEPVMRKPAGKLSGGQRNMLAVARALMSNPEVLLLDEATAGLAPGPQAKLWGALVQLAQEGIAVAVVEQNVRLALEHSHTVYLLGSGRNRMVGPAAEFAAREDLEALFLEAAEQQEGDRQAVRR